MTATTSGAQVFHEEMAGRMETDTIPPPMKPQDEPRTAFSLVKYWPIIVCVAGFVAQYVGMSGKIDMLLEQSRLHGQQLARIEAKVIEHDTFIAILRDREQRK